MIGSDETDIEGEIVYKAPGGQREPTIEIVEIEENVRGRGGGGDEEERMGWGGREGRRRGRKRRPGRQNEREEEEREEEEEEKEEERIEKDFRYDKNLFRSPASNQQTPSYLILTLIIPLVFHSQTRPYFY